MKRHDQSSSKGVINGLFPLIGLPVLLLLPAPSICILGASLSLDSVLTTNPLRSIAFAIPKPFKPSPTLAP